MFFDTHAHYNDKRFKFDRDKAIMEAYNNKVTKIMNVSYNFNSLFESKQIASKYDFVYFTVGIHPHYSKDMNDETLDKIENYTKNSKCKAIGEIGLDYFRDLSPREVQKKWFIEQINLAKKLNLPIVIHVRDSYEDVLSILKMTNASEIGGIIHSYCGNLKLSKEFLNLNFYLSFSGQITYRNTRELQEVVKNIPLDRVLIETDSPYLTPEPFRGKRNESIFVKLVAEKISEIKNMSLEEIANISYSNAKKLFKIDV